MMRLMTWGEFKQEMERQGAQDDDPIQYIDFSWPDVHDQQLEGIIRVFFNGKPDEHRRICVL